MEYLHTPVMPSEVLEWLVPSDEEQLLVDATVGEGGHSALFLESHPTLHVIGVDADPRMTERAHSRLAQFGDRVELRQAWFDEFFDSYAEARAPDRILLDLGVSGYHFAGSGRGFSFRGTEPLDMRLAPDSGPSAEDLVHALTEGELADMIYEYGEERYARRIAERIVRERGNRRIATTADLAQIVWRAVPRQYRHGRIHPATRTFQALRIAVNRELERVERGLEAALRVLIPGGIIGVIAFHSLEDRRVKHCFRRHEYRSKRAESEPMSLERESLLRILTKKPLMPGEEERRRNPAARSARFRVARKVAASAAAEGVT
ncbi:MAG: 16S rRNA (cytosine(1402)-N(4))-methyltransferase RsmH [Spirochaetaceae bacterium]